MSKPRLSPHSRFLACLKRGYNPSSPSCLALKLEWKRASRLFFQDLALRLDASSTSHWFNQGGPAVSGDAHLMLERNGKYLHLFGNLDIDFLVVRPCRSFTDFTGGPNHCLHHHSFEDIPYLLNLFNSLLERTLP